MATGRSQARPRLDRPQAKPRTSAAVSFVRALRWVERISIFGYQWGSQPAALLPAKPKQNRQLALRHALAPGRQRRRQPPRSPALSGQQAALLASEDGDLDRSLCAAAPRSVVAIGYRPNGACWWT